MNSAEPIVAGRERLADQSSKFTVIIPCKDERLNIGDCIDAARAVADEILVADSGSTDGTLEIVRQRGDCRILEREFRQYGDFNNWAIPQATYPWVLIVDADERITSKLAAEIKNLLAAGPTMDGYWIRRANFFLGQRVRFSGWQNDRVLRLFRRDLGRFCGDTDHAQVKLPMHRTGTLVSRLNHFTYRTYDDYFRKFMRYTDQCAKLKYETGVRRSTLRLLLTVPLSFLRAYVLRLGFLDGTIGLQVCWLTAFSSYMKQAKLWQLHHFTRISASKSASPSAASDESAAPTFSEITCQ
jgi:glycosyltransferase involved in cell wall biosynthesis